MTRVARRVLGILVPIASLMACGGGGGGGEPVGSPQAGPGPFGLISPSYGSQSAAVSPILRWKESSGARSYRVQIDDDPYFSNCEFEKGGLSSLSLAIPPGILTEDTAYYWRVFAVNDVGEILAGNAPFKFVPNLWARSFSPDVGSLVLQSCRPSTSGGSFVGGHHVVSREVLAVLVARLDANGAVEWIRSSGIPEGEGVDLTGVFPTADGGCVVAARRTVASGIRSILLARFAAGGAVAWQRSYTFAGSGVSTIGVRGLAETSDGALLVVGQHEGGAALLMKVKADGTSQWARIYGTGGRFNAVAETPEGGYLAAGEFFYVDPSTNLQLSYSWVVKTNAGGAVEWQKQYIPDRGILGRIVALEDGGCVVAGWYAKGSSFGDCLVRLDSSGEFQWGRGIGAWNTPGFRSLARAQDGGFLVFGSINTDSSYLLRTNAEGDADWGQRIRMSEAGLLTQARTVSEAPDGGLFLGATGSGRWQVMRIDRDGSLPGVSTPLDIGVQPLYWSPIPTTATTELWSVSEEILTATWGGDLVVTKHDDVP